MSTSGHGVHDRQTLKERLDKECCYYELGGKIWKDITHVQAPYLTGSTRIGRSVTTSEQELRGRSIGANTVAPHNDGISESEEDEHSSPTPSFVQAQSATREEMPIQGSSRDINTLQRRPTVRQASRSVTGSIADAGRHIRARTASDSLEMLRVQRENSESVLSKYQEEFLKLEREKLEEMKKFNEEMISVKRLKIESNTVDILKMKIDLINKKIELENLLQRRTQQGGTAAEPAFGTIDPSILSILRE
ncbi:unnamed protein product [Allacma fusca]|uniref:Uncharacterized protein n=1 Tax=Allacma fusca TaxID=39272 RepID=A0A8J2LKR3_9HEXA|nr:unnamed protein product [Allacma fusca]